MITDHLRINQLSPAAYRWYLAYLTALDARDLAAYGSFLAETCTLQSNNQPAVVGKTAIIEALGQYWQSFSSLEHDLLNIYGSDSAFALEALNHYTRLDGQPVTLRAVAFTDRNPTGAVIAVRFYTDTAPLFA